MSRLSYQTRRGGIAESGVGKPQVFLSPPGSDSSGAAVGELATLEQVTDIKFRLLEGDEGRFS